MNFAQVVSFLPGEELEFTGPGFFGFDPEERKVIYVMEDEDSYMYIWVKYKAAYKRLHANELKRSNNKAA